jgi:hypothetical protein
MSSIIQIKSKEVAGDAPATLEHGELAVNTADGKLWAGNAAKAPVEVNSGRWGVITGNTSRTAAASDSLIKPQLYVANAAAQFDLTLPTATAGGYVVGDVISLVNTHGQNTLTQFVAGAGVTLIPSARKQPQLRAFNCIISAVYLTDTQLFIYGDLADI